MRRKGWAVDDFLPQIESSPKIKLHKGQRRFAQNRGRELRAKKLFSKILVANRGEIAVRVVRACRELGIQTAAIFSEADADSLHVRLADEKHLVGPPPSNKSYLNIENILKAAAAAKADAIHPGYGYLSEVGEFAKVCEKEGLVFIGPTPESLHASGDKIEARDRVGRAGVPLIPSSPGAVETLEEAAHFSRLVGYPVMVKASGGGGGRGIRICRDEETLREEFPVARMEARAAFGNDDVYIEKCIVEPRHVEFQVLADRAGNVIHLGERECTIQRRHQKLIEESPSPRLTPELRQEMGRAAVAAATALKYFNAGTVEFLLAPDDHFYFLEINARIQVEHPVTEVVTGIDLVKEQIRLASGEDLGYSTEDVKRRGWAIECRINAEDPERSFLPSPGTISEYHPPGGFGVRLDTHLYQGYELPMYYDSLLAKLIAHDLTRLGAIRILRRALQELTIKPIKTTIPLHLRILDDPLFQKGEFSTNFVHNFVPEEQDEED